MDDLPQAAAQHRQGLGHRLLEPRPGGLEAADDPGLEVALAAMLGAVPGEVAGEVTGHRPELEGEGRAQIGRQVEVGVLALEAEPGALLDQPLGDEPVEQGLEPPLELDRKSVV